MRTIRLRLLQQKQQIMSLKKQNAILQEELSTLDKKTVIFDEMIQLAEKEYQTYMRKNATK